MKKQTKKWIAIILAVISVLSVFVPVIASAEVVGNKYDFSSYNTHRAADLVDLKWVNAMKVNFVGTTYSICYSDGLTGISTTYADKDGVVYELKVLDDTTCIITDIALPIGYTEITIPEIVSTYRLVSGAVTENITDEDIVYMLDGSNENLSMYYNFSSCLTPIMKDNVQVGVKGRPISVYKHDFQVVGIATSLSRNKIAETVIVSSLITTLEAGAFEDNHYIKNIYAPSVTEIRSQAFYDCNELVYAEFPAVRYVASKAFCQCNKLLDFNFSSILSIGESAFYDCVQFKQVTLCDKLNNLEKGAFANCTGLTEVTIPDGVSINAVPQDAFKNCTSLQKVNLPKEIIKIEANAFYGDTGLMDFTFPQNLDTIGSKAFWGCIGLDYIVLPEKLVTFNADAFDNCTGLRFVYFTRDLSDSQITQLKKSSIANCSVLPKENMGVQLWNKTANVLAGKEVTIYRPTTFDIFDTVDISGITIDPYVNVDMSLSDAHKSYKTRMGTIEITEPGKYTITVTDMFNKEETLTIDYQVVNKYTVMFEGNGATSGTMDNQELVIGEKVKLPKNIFSKSTVVKFEYQNGKASTHTTSTSSFLGWSTTANGSKIYNNMQEVNGLSSVTGDVVTLYAVWYNSTIALPTPTRTNYTFVGWNTEPDGSGYYVEANENYTVPEITVYGIWKPVAYSVKFNGNGATAGSMENQEFEYDENKALSENAFVKSYSVELNYENGKDTANTLESTSEFLGWATTAKGEVVYDDCEEVINLSSKNGAVVTLYAVWHNNTLVLGIPEREGYTFNGWYTASGSKINDGIGEYAPTASIKLYARWTPISYTVSYYLDNNLYSQKIYKYDTINSYLGLPTKTGYTVSGWNTSSDMKGKTYAAGDKFNNLSSVNGAEIRYYSVSSPYSYVVKFNGNGATAGTMAEQKIVFDAKTPLTANNFEKKYTVKYDNGNGTVDVKTYSATFEGWSTSNTAAILYSDKDEVLNLTKTLNGVYNLYARWGSMTVQLPVLSKTGYKFLGWNTKADGKGKYVADTKGCYTPTANVTLYAIWEKLYENGDIDMDGKVTAADARLALRSSVGLEKFNAAETELADMDKDTKVTAADARLILRKSVGLDK